jgi:hypothetical protein
MDRHKLPKEVMLPWSAHMLYSPGYNRWQEALSTPPAHPSTGPQVERNPLPNAQGLVSTWAFWRAKHN